MSAPAKQGGSRWGSFLQQAVAGIEQNLDNILSGDDVPQTHVKPAAPAAAAKEAAAPTPPRSATPNSNSRLQERLAKAVAAKAAAARNSAQIPTSTPPSRAGAPSILSASPRQSIDSTAAAEEKEDKNAAANKVEEGKAKENEAVPRVSIEDTKKHDAFAPTAQEQEDTAAASATMELLKDKIKNNSPRPSTDSASIARQSFGYRQSLQIIDSSTRSSEDSNPRVQQIIADADREEEIYSYIERIDALQAKLTYLAKESAESARKAAAEAGQGTLQQKLAQKDEQIALLMEEGQKLSKTELKHMTVIKKLRASTTTFEKEAKQNKEKLEKSEKEKASLAERVKHLESDSKQASQNQKWIAQLERALEAQRAENKSKSETIEELKKRLKDAASQVTGEEVKKLTAELHDKRSRMNDLEAEASSEKIERELVEEKLKAREKELYAKMEREAERARVAEVELRSEIQVLEGRLEIMRSRAEEVSSGATGESQAKLLRQIETLQSQYAVASENWQGIESSLISRVTTLSKERDEALKREGDTKKKAREMTQKAKSTEEETESLNGRITQLSQELSNLQSKLADVQKRAEESEAALKAAKERFEKERQSLASEIRQQIEEERRPSSTMPPQSPFMGSAVGGNFDTHRAVSEVASSRRGLTAEFLGLQNIQTGRRPSRGVIDDVPYPLRNISRTGSKANIYFGSPGGERASIGCATPKRQDSNLLLSPTDGLGDRGMAISGDRALAGGMVQDPDDYFENVASAADAVGLNGDGLGSVSTQAAGPSVQLVERMSAAVRRLENEKVAMREELTRLAKQRDEARSEITSLMREVEEKRQDYEKVEDLRKDIEVINSRYQTTLEMLGEKTEMVEELKADVGDLKGMYRNLAEEYAKLKK